MSRMTITKIRKIFGITLIPRIIRNEFSLTPSNLVKRPFDGLWKANKSTDAKDPEAECEKCKKIIEMVFGPDKPETVLKNIEANVENINMSKLQNAIAPNISVKDKSNDKSEVEADTFLTVNNTKKNLKTIDNELPVTVKKPFNQGQVDNITQFTTAKENKEELAQKLEIIEDPELIKYDIPKTEGFSTPTKVLPNHDDKNSLFMKIGPEEDAIDEIAKKCFSTPPDKIDERIIEEMKSCRLLGRGRRKSITRKSRSHMSNKNESLFDTRPDESTLYCKKQPAPIRPLNSHPYIHYRNIKMTQHRKKINAAYLKNVPLDLSGDGHSKLKTDSQNAITDDQKQKSQSDVQCNHANKKSDISNEVSSAEREMIKSVNEKKENIKKEVETLDDDIEEIRVTAAETSRIGRPDQTELEIDNSHDPIKPGILPCNHVKHALQSNFDNPLCVAEERESHAAISNPDFSTENPELNVLKPPFNSPNTAISGTFPQYEVIPEPDVKDTAISSWQDPAEFYELSHCNIQKLDDYAISPSAIRPLEAYHPYTIISGTEVREPQNILFSSKAPNNVSSDIPLKETKETPNTINKEVSAAMGPLPELKDMDEELSLSEMLRRVRERNRLQYCRECEYKMVEAEPAEANRCPPPLDKGPSKTLGPDPCKPKAKPACPPPPKCPPPCPPPPSPPCKPKDPCAKFKKSSLIGEKIMEAFIFILQIGLKPSCTPPISASDCNVKTVEPLKDVFMSDADKIEKLGSFLLSGRFREKSLPKNEDDVVLTRDYTPWTPIPSWPIPKKEESRPCVCPKEGCKINPPLQQNPPCKEKPCDSFPKRTFSAFNIDYVPIYSNENEY